MSNLPFHSEYLESEAASHATQYLAKGVKAVRDVSGGRHADGSITFSGNFTANDTVTVNGVVFTAVASGASGNQFNVAGSLSGSLDNLVTVLNNSTDEHVNVATYSKTGSDDTLTVVYDTETEVGNAFTLDASVGTVNDSTLSGGVTPDPLEDAAVFYLVTVDGDDMDFVLPYGIDGQEVTLYFKTKGTGSNAVVHGTFAGGDTEATFDAEGEFVKLQWLNDAWEVVLNHGSVSFA